MGKNKQNCDSENINKGHKKIAEAKISYSRAISSSLIDRELSDNHNPSINFLVVQYKLKKSNISNLIMMLDDENSFSNTGIIKSS